MVYNFMNQYIVHIMAPDLDALVKFGYIQVKCRIVIKVNAKIILQTNKRPSEPKKCDTTLKIV